jgi:uncharacterized protein (DUF58 family)
MTRSRLISLGFIAAAAVFASFFGGSFSYALFYAAVAVPASCLIYVIFVYIKLRVYQVIDSKIVVKGDKIGYKYIISNESTVFFADIRTEFLSDYSKVNIQDNAGGISLAPSQKAEHSTELTCLYRGEYKVGVKEIVVTDYLGLFKLKRRNSSAMNIRVYPRVVELASLAALSFGNDVKSLPFTLKQGQEPDSEMRGFLLGDSVNSINWKASAKSGLSELYVRRRTEPPKEKVAVYIDTAPLADEKRIQTEDKILETALAIINYCLRQRIATEIIYYSNALTRISINNRADFTRFYDSCLYLAFRGEENAFDYITEIDAAVLVVITAEPGSRFSDALSRFSAQFAMHTCVILTGNRESDELSAIRESLGKTALIHIPDESGVSDVLDKAHDF